MIWLSTPGASVEHFFDDLGALPAGPPDMERVLGIFAQYDIQIVQPTAT